MTDDTSFWPNGASPAISMSLMYEGGGQPISGAPGVRRGHEAAAHGPSWSASYDMSPADEREFIIDNMKSIERTTGQTPKGWSAYWVRNSPHIPRYPERPRLHLLPGRSEHGSTIHLAS
jgi:peptidoglycan/xylan/chitin deacetylase (PgdA/CDA1 family)